MSSKFGVLGIKTLRAVIDLVLLFPSSPLNDGFARLEGFASPLVLRKCMEPNVGFWGKTNPWEGDLSYFWQKKKSAAMLQFSSSGLLEVLTSRCCFP